MLWQTCQVSRISRESPAFVPCLQHSRQPLAFSRTSGTQYINTVMLLEKAIELALKCHRTDSNQGLLDKFQQLQFADQRHKILNWDYLLLQLLVIAICGLCYCLSCLWTCLLNLKCNLQQNMTKIAKTPAISDLFSSYGHIITWQVWLDSMLNSSYQNRDVACGVIASFKYACMAKFSCFFFFVFFYHTMEIDI